MHGFGIFYYLSGNRQEGEWKNGRKDGKATFQHNNGIIFDGYAKEGQKHGKSTIQYPDGTSREANFNMGEAIDEEWSSEEWIIEEESEIVLKLNKNKNT